MADLAPGFPTMALRFIQREQTFNTDATGHALPASVIRVERVRVLQQEWLTERGPEWRDVQLVVDTKDPSKGGQ